MDGPRGGRSPPRTQHYISRQERNKGGVARPASPAACPGRPERLCPGRTECCQPFAVWKNPDSPGVPERPGSGVSEERRLLPTPGQPFVSAEFMGDPGDPTAAGGKGPEANLGAEPPSHQAKPGHVVRRPVGRASHCSVRTPQSLLGSKHQVTFY